MYIDTIDKRQGKLNHNEGNTIIRDHLLVNKIMTSQKTNNLKRSVVDRGYIFLVDKDIHMD